MGQLQVMNKLLNINSCLKFQEDITTFSQNSDETLLQDYILCLRY